MWNLVFVVKKPASSCVSHDMDPLITVKVKVKCARYRPGVAQRLGRGIALFFHDHGTRRGWVVSSTPRPHFTPGKEPVPIYRRLGGRQSRSGRAENLVPNGIRSRTVQPVVSRYTDWATGPTLITVRVWNKLMLKSHIGLRLIIPKLVFNHF